MKKIYLSIILIIIIIVALLIKTNIILLSKGKIDNLKYSVIDRKFEISSKIVNYSDYDNLNLSNQYREMNFNNNIYIAIISSNINENLIEKFINKITLTGYNEENLKPISTIASIYKINNISENVAVAVKFENTDNYYTYLNSYCKPTTLNDLITMYNLEEYISLNSITYTKNINFYDFFERNINLDFSNISNTEFENIIFNNTDIPITYNSNTNYNKCFKFNITSPIYNSFFILLNRNGDLIITIPAIGNSFTCNIGNTNYNSFLKYIESQESKAKIHSLLYI